MNDIYSLYDYDYDVLLEQNETIIEWQKYNRENKHSHSIWSSENTMAIKFRKEL